MADINTGSPKRFKNGGILELMGSTDNIVQFRDGTLRIRAMQEERIQWKFKGQQQAPIVGDQRTHELEFSIFFTAGTESLIAGMLPAATNGVETYFGMNIKAPHYLNASTGHKVEPRKLWLPEGWEYQAGDELDEIRFRLLSNDAMSVLTWTEY